jgi:hypothetical protein
MALILSQKSDSLKCERRHPKGRPVIALFAAELPKVKQMRAFLDG